MSSDKALTIQRGPDGFVGLYGELSCSPGVHQVMSGLGQDIAAPGGGSFADLEAAFPVWIAKGGPWSRWYIHKSSYADWASQQPAVERAANLLRANGYDVDVTAETAP